MAELNPVQDLRTRRYQAAWDHITRLGGPKQWETELQGLPLAIRQQGLAPQLALMIGRGKTDLDIANALATWVFDQGLLPRPARRDRHAARDLLAAAATAEGLFALAAATDEAIEFAAALKRLAV